MIYGIGTDICCVERMRSVYQDLGERCVVRFLGEQERLEFNVHLSYSQSRAIVYLASRFSAKEAFSKAWGTGIGHALSFQDIQILNQENGQPYCLFSDQFGRDFKDYQAHVSISTEVEYVSTFVVIEQKMCL